MCALSTKIVFLFVHNHDNHDILTGFLQKSTVFRAALAAYGSSQARGLIVAVAAGLHHSHSNARSKPHLQPTPQLVATLDP